MEINGTVLNETTLLPCVKGKEILLLQQCVNCEDSYKGPTYYTVTMNTATYSGPMLTVKIVTKIQF
jgi:hypothetical protein